MHIVFSIVFSIQFWIGLVIGGLVGFVIEFFVARNNRATEFKANALLDQINNDAKKISEEIKK